MNVYVLSGNIGTGKTAFAETLKQSHPKMMYLDVEALKRNLNIGSIEYNPSLAAISQGITKDFVRRAISMHADVIVIETMSVSSKSRKGLRTMIKNAVEETGMKDGYDIILCNFGPGDAKSLEKAASNPYIVSGGNKMVSMIENINHINQTSYDAPRGEEGYLIMQNMI